MKFIGKDVAKKDGFALDELEVASLNLQRMKNGAGFEAGLNTDVVKEGPLWVTVLEMIEPCECGELEQKAASASLFKQEEYNALYNAIPYPGPFFALPARIRFARIRLR